MRFYRRYVFNWGGGGLGWGIYYLFCEKISWPSLFLSRKHVALPIPILQLHMHQFTTIGNSTTLP